MEWNGDKCDLHRHMGGSISPQTVIEILRRSGTKLRLDDAINRMVCNGSNIGFKTFLDKFKILDSVPWPDWAIDLAIEQICSDLSAENIQYTEISLSINKYVYANKWSPKDVAMFIAESFRHHANKHKTEVGILLSLRYDSNREDQELYGQLVNDEDLRGLFCGIDLIGNEDLFDAEFYKPIFDEWRFNGKTLRAHVGEMPGKGANVREAIEILGVNRIAHGVQADDDTLKLAADRGVCFDLALHSNIITGAISNIKTHPIKRMMAAGCRVTLNTDDPIQFNCTLDSEFDLALRNGLIDEDQAIILMRNAWIASHHNRSL